MAPQRKYLDKLAGKRVLIFGGTSGIGFSVAEAATEFGAHVIVSSSTTGKIDATIKRLSASYPDAASRVSGHRSDLSKADTLEANIEATLKFATNDGANKLDHIVYTAGGPAFGLLPDLTTSLLNDALLMRTVAPAIIGKLIPKYVRTSHESSFTTTSGSGVYTPPPGFFLNAISGRALEGLTSSLAVELKPVRVNLVVPGPINTELLASLANMENLASLNSQNLLGRIGEPEETAEAYLYIMKDNFITGSLIHTNGGSFLKT